MSISTRVGSYLDTHEIKYNTIPHNHSFSSLSTASAAHITPRSIAKAVVLEDHEGRHMMAVLPASNKISMHKLEEHLNLQFKLAEEYQVYNMFKDCAAGAVPAVGQAYNMNAIYDEALNGLEDVYLEAGDHETLIHLTHEEFEKLMMNTNHTLFSGEVFH